MPPRRVDVTDGPTAREVAYLRSLLVVERERYDALVKEVLVLKRDGFSATVQYEAPPPTPPLPASVRTAIAERSEPLTPERRELERHAADALRAGMTDAAVAQQVLDGEDTGF